MTRSGPSTKQLYDVALRYLTHEHAELFARQTRTTIRLQRTSDPASLVRLGGRPVLGETPWPIGAEKPLSFLGLIDLAAFTIEKSRLAVPADGYLNFFYDADSQPWGTKPEDRVGWRVIHTVDDDAGLAVPPPGARVFEPIDLEGESWLTSPGFEEPVLRSILGVGYEGLDDLRQLQMSLAEMRWDTTNPRHQIGGWPILMQAPIWSDCELGLREIEAFSAAAAELRRTEAFLDDLQDWRLLLQLDSDPTGTGWNWNGSGVIYFAIRNVDLKNLRFDRVWVVRQST